MNRGAFRLSVRFVILLAVIGGAFGAAQPAAGQSAAREQEIARAAEALREKLIETRRHLHRHPELSNREEKTAAYIAERLRALGFDEVKTGVAKHGVVGLLRGSKPGPVVALRADMDALPIEETIDVPYKSRNPGVKHACGHDVHMTVALGVAEILSQRRDLVQGTVKFIFQPAEEGLPEGEEGGALLMVKEGALENPRPLAIFGLHVMPDLEAGKIGYGSGGVMAAADHFTITIRGRKTHGAYPHEGVDPVPVAAEAILALQTIRSRRVSPIEPMVLSVGVIQGGNRFNILPDEVRLEGTLRTLNEDLRQRVRKWMNDILEGVTRAHGATFEIKMREGAAVTYNDPKLVEETLPAMRRAIGDENVVPYPPKMGAEDFSYFLREIPGFYYMLGVGNKAKGITAWIHTPEFDADEESLVVGARVMTGVLVDFLARHAVE
jgi:amidohydrolase